MFDIALTTDPIDPVALLGRPGPQEGACFLFTGNVRDEEDGHRITALVYEAYEAMAHAEMLRLAETLAQELAVLRGTIVHRIGTIPVSEVAIAIVVYTRHRAEGLEFVRRFMEDLKTEVPIWKVRSVTEDPIC